MLAKENPESKHSETIYKITNIEGDETIVVESNYRVEGVKILGGEKKILSFIPK